MKTHHLQATALLVAWLALPALVSAQADTDRDFRLGKGLYNQQFYDRAIPPLERVRSGNAPREQLEEALFLLGEAYRSGADFEKSEERFEELLTGFPRSEWRRVAQVGRGESLVRLGEHDDAIAVLKSLLGDPGEEKAQGLYWLAEAQSQKGAPAEAVGSYQRLIMEVPSHQLVPYAAYNAGLLLRDADRPREGLQLLQAVDLAKAPKDLSDQLYLLRGDLALRAGEPDQAIEDYSRVGIGDLKRSALAGICWASRELENEDQFGTARDILRSSYAGSEEVAEVDILLGAWRADGGRVEEADAALDSHVGGPRSTEAIYWKGWARLRAGQHEEAARVFGEAARGSDHWAVDASYHREGELRRAEQWDAALQAAESFLLEHKDDPRAADVLAGATESAFRTGDDSRVMLLEATFKTRHPDHLLTPQVVRFAAESALRSGELDEAVVRFEALWAGADVAQKQDLAPRLAWALYQREPARSGDAIGRLFSQVAGVSAAEVGILLGRARYAEGRHDAALQAFRAASASDPGGEAGMRALLEEAVLLAETETGAGQRSAEVAYRKVLDGGAAGLVRGRAIIDLAELLARRGDFAAAIPYFELYISEFPAGEFAAASRLGLAFSRWREGDLDGASEAVAELQASGDDPAILAESVYLEGRLEADKKNLDGAEAAYARYLEEYRSGPREAEVLREIARVEEEAGKPQEARGHLELLVTGYPDIAGADEARYRLAWLQAESGDRDEATRSFEELIANHPESAYLGDAHYRLGDFAYQDEDFERARGRYELALGAPGSERLAERAIYRIGWSWIRQEKWKEAQDSFVRLADNFPEAELAGESLFLAADAAGRRNDIRAERELLERFVGRHSSHELASEAKIRLCELLTSDGEWRRIRELLEPLKGEELPGELEPRHRVALGRALVRLGAAKTGIKLLEEALKEGKAIAAEAQFEIGIAHRELGDRPRAVEVFINGPVLYPYRPWAVRSYVEAGRDLIEEGKPDEAARVLNLALKQDEDGDWGKEARKLLASIDKESS